MCGGDGSETEETISHPQQRVLNDIYFLITAQKSLAPFLGSILIKWHLE